MNPNQLLPARRRFITQVGIGAAAMAAARLFDPGAGAFANELDQRVLTPQMTEGPFYPDRLPLDTDNDLLIVNDAITPAVGAVTHLGGRILDPHGDPLNNAVIEIWQVDNLGSYIHSRGTNRQTAQRDPNFQGYGRFLTSSTGEYYFRTIRPVPYPGRTPHIHVRVKAKGQETLTTQCFINGEPRNQRDGVLNDLRSAKARQAVLTDFIPLKNSRIGELAARFDIVLGATPEMDDPG